MRHYKYAEIPSPIMRKEDKLMKNKKRFLSILSIIVPVAIAAIDELGDQMEAKKHEEEMEEMNKRIEALEKNNEEA